MKKLAFLLFVLAIGTSIAVAVKANESKAAPYCHCEPDWTCNSTGAWGIKTTICP